MAALHLLPLVVAIPLAAAFLSPLAPKRSRVISNALALGASLGLAIVVGALYSGVAFLRHAGKTSESYWVGGWVLRKVKEGLWSPVGIEMRFDGLTWLMLAVVAGVSLCVILYAMRYMGRYTARGKFYALFFLMVAGMCGVVVTGDLFNMYVFLEIAAIASYALVAFGCEAEEMEASFKYAVLGSIASSLILLGLALLYGRFGTVNLAHLAAKIAGAPAEAKPLITFAQVLFFAGFALKAALVPFHAWLPDAHPSAPAPVSAMLSGVLIKTIGVYALARLLFNVFGMSPGGRVSYALMLLGALSILTGSALALAQWDLKRLLAYSSIAQIGYVVLGIGLGTPLGVVAGLFHLVNHSVFKSLLFLNAGAVEHATGTRDLGRMGGLRERMPVTATTSMAASMALAGVPPFNGFFSKLMVIVACVQAGRHGFALLAVLGSIATLAYVLRVQRHGFFGKLREKWREVREAPLAMSAAMVILALACLALSLLWLPGLREAVLGPARDALLARPAEFARTLAGR